jgi:hypothetical protein
MPLSETVLLVHPLDKNVVTFLQSSMPVSMAPMQVARDFNKANINFNALTPHRYSKATVHKYVV